MTVDLVGFLRDGRPEGTSTPHTKYCRTCRQKGAFLSFR